MYVVLSMTRASFLILAWSVMKGLLGLTHVMCINSRLIFVLFIFHCMLHLHVSLSMFYSKWPYTGISHFCTLFAPLSAPKMEG